MSKGIDTAELEHIWKVGLGSICWAHKLIPLFNFGDAHFQEHIAESLFMENLIFSEAVWNYEKVSDA